MHICTLLSVVSLLLVLDNIIKAVVAQNFVAGGGSVF
jgi:lipoprotein signal peptidase